MSQKTKVVSFSIPQNCIDYVNKLRDLRGCSASRIVTEAISSRMGELSLQTNMADALGLPKAILAPEWGPGIYHPLASCCPSCGAPAGALCEFGAERYVDPEVETYCAARIRATVNRNRVHMEIVQRKRSSAAAAPRPSGRECGE